MINLPPKPVQKPPGSISTQPPSQVAPSIPKPPSLSPVGGQTLTPPVPPKPPSIPGVVPPVPGPSSAAGAGVAGAVSSPPPPPPGMPGSVSIPKPPAVANVPPPPATARPASLASVAPLAPKPPGLNIPSATIPPTGLGKAPSVAAAPLLLLLSLKRRRRRSRRAPRVRGRYLRHQSTCRKSLAHPSLPFRPRSRLRRVLRSLWRLKFKLSLLWASVWAFWLYLLRRQRLRSSSG